MSVSEDSEPRELGAEDFDSVSAPSPKVDNSGEAASASPSSSNDESKPAKKKRTVLAGKYVLERQIARGAMGRVFSATQLNLKRRVAVKVMAPRYGGPDFNKRFLLEARSVAALSHPHIVTVHDYGQTKNGLLYMAMEFLDGPTLGRAIRDDGPMPLGRACFVAIQVARALRTAHEQGLIHRDLKPGNIILLDDKDHGVHTKVLDFGLAKVVEGPKDDDDMPMTRDGLMLGTPRYMAPEQILSQETDGRADLYGLGACLYQMLSGRPPFSGDNDVEILNAQLKSGPTPLRDLEGCDHIPEELDAFVLKTMARDAADRPETAQAFLDELRHILQTAVEQPDVRRQFVTDEIALIAPNSLGSSHSRPTPLTGGHPEAPAPIAAPVEQAPEEEKKRRAAILLLPLLLLLLVGGFAVWKLTGDDGDTPRTDVAKPVADDIATDPVDVATKEVVKDEPVEARPDEIEDDQPSTEPKVATSDDKPKPRRRAKRRVTKKPKPKPVAVATPSIPTLEEDEPKKDTKPAIGIIEDTKAKIGTLDDDKPAIGLIKEEDKRPAVGTID